MTEQKASRRPPQILPVDQLGGAADIVVACAPSSQLRATPANPGPDQALGGEG